jgi:hypothetical protein
MKKAKLTFSMLAMIIAIIFTSCDKDVDTSAVKIDLDKSGTITVYVYAQLDLTNAGTEVVPNGTELFVKINYSDFKGGLTGAWQQTVTVGDSGKVHFTVPADDDGVTARISPLPFEHAQVSSYGAYAETTPKLFTANTQNYSISAGQSITKQITYTAENFANNVEMVEISGQIIADLNDTILGSEDVMQSVTIDFHNSEWTEEVTTTAEGEYTVVVPANKAILVTALFQASKYIDLEGGTVLYEYELKSKTFGTYSTSLENVDIDFGAGLEVEE